MDLEFNYIIEDGNWIHKGKQVRVIHYTKYGKKDRNNLLKFSNWFNSCIKLTISILNYCEKISYKYCLIKGSQNFRSRVISCCGI